MGKEIPNFGSEDEEREFWSHHDSTDFLEGAVEINMQKTGMTLEDWAALSREGEVCGILGCKNKPIVRCPHCGNHYCSQHSFVIDTPAHPRKKEGK